VILPQQGSVAFVNIDEDSECIKLVNQNFVCDNEVVKFIGQIEPTTTTTTEAPVETTTTTTTEATTTTTTESGGTTTTTVAPTVLYISTFREDCSDFCTTNYNITTQRESTHDYINLTIGTIISGITVASFYAVSGESTDTDTGPFKIVETDATGEVISILECVDGTCTEL